jgi:hypothetical protein
MLIPQAATAQQDAFVPPEKVPVVRAFDNERCEYCDVV